VANSLRVRFNTGCLWIGLDWVGKNGPTSNSAFSTQIRNNLHEATLFSIHIGDAAATAFNRIRAAYKSRAIRLADTSK